MEEDGLWEKPSSLLRHHPGTTRSADSTERHDSRTVRHAHRPTRHAKTNPNNSNQVVVYNHHAKTYDSSAPIPSYGTNFARRKITKKESSSSPNARQRPGTKMGTTSTQLLTVDADPKHEEYTFKRLEVNSNDSDSSKPPSVFDVEERDPSNARQRSLSSARSAVTEDSQQSGRVPCEFGWLDHCETDHFTLTQKNAWIEHSKSHLRGTFPALCHCWFCGLEFRANDGSESSCKNAFERRLSHIWEHFARNRSITQPIRPDFPLLDHLESHRLISEEKLEASRNLSQLIVKTYSLLSSSHPYHAGTNFVLKVTLLSIVREAAAGQTAPRVT
ncbi:hypothetical protein GGR57DRAFT_240041 [Xylariaceae sp. FL1272]|nr:hypothetical protein GGR57DRAFT_240041 [Xylariaceae sp. FL1272]